MKPSVGRIVHYVGYGTPGGEYGRECRAAIVTAVGRPSEPIPTKLPDVPDLVGVTVLNPEGLFFNRYVQFSEGTPEEGSALCCGYGYPGGTWHWPERV